MLKIVLIVFLSGITLLQAIDASYGYCEGSTSTYKNQVSNQHTTDMNSLASTIDTITDLIKDNIKSVENDSNLDMYETIENLKNGETMSILKRNFTSKIHLELQSILNSVIGE